MDSKELALKLKFIYNQKMELIDLASISEILQAMTYLFMDKYLNKIHNI